MSVLLYFILCERIENSGLLLVVFINQQESRDFDPKAVVFLVKVVYLLKGCKHLFSHIEKKYRNSLGSI